MADSLWQRIKHSEVLTIGNQRYAIYSSLQTGYEQRDTSDEPWNCEGYWEASMTVSTPRKMGWMRQWYT